jgi:hypothetical protein
VTLVSIGVSEENIDSIIRVTRIGELGTLAITGIAMFQLLITANIVPRSLFVFTLLMAAIPSSETSVLTRDMRRNIPEDSSLHSHRRENLKSYIALTG